MSSSNALPEESQKPPPITACFLVEFDQTVGYNLTWARSVPGFQLEDAGIEYKALPSGLHKVKEDLIYFIHDGHAGLARFHNSTAGAAERNAKFLSVGVLLPLRGGRLGQAWRHAEALDRIAKTLSEDTEATHILEEHWVSHRLPRDLTSGEQSQSGDNEADEEPNTTVDEELSGYHPILQMRQFIDVLGPLIFPLYRAALLRKRILLLKPPPIHRSVDFVYILSLLSAIPSAMMNRLPEGSAVRSRSLFAVGISDISTLESGGDTLQNDGPPESGWIACSSDELLSTKSRLYDLKVEFPEIFNKTSRPPFWPKLTFSTGATAKATQRDLRRFKALRDGLVEFEEDAAGYNEQQEDEEDESASLIRRDKSFSRTDNAVPEENEAVEQASWAAIAYDSFIWWASAGERNSQLEEEYLQDKELPFQASQLLVLGSMEQSQDLASAAKLRGGALEMAVIAYFHRLTTAIMSTLLQLVTQFETEAEENDVHILHVSREDMEQMGLDTWSKADRVFVADLLKAYWGTDSEIQGSSIECCGVKFY